MPPQPHPIGHPASEVEVELPTGALTVKVMDATGGPIAGAVVATEFTRVGSTDSTGKCQIDPASLGLPLAGELTASAEGYGTETKYYRSPSTVIFKLLPQSRISGRVVEKETGNPVAGIAVDMGDAPLAVTDTDGSFMIRGAPPGTYRIRGRNKLWYGNLEPSISVGPASVVENVRLEVTHGFVIRGKVFVNDRPVSNQQVSGGETVATTNAFGEYELDAVPPGQYTLEVSGGEPQQALYRHNSSVRISVVDRDVTANINLGKRVSVSFVVVDRKGRPQERINLDLKQQNAQVQASAECLTNHDGSCTVEGAIPGLMLARVAASVPYREIEVPTPSNEPVRFVVDEGVAVAGRIVRSDGGAVGSRYILLGATDGKQSQSTRCQPDGSFTFARVLAGNYRIQVRASSISSSDDAEEANLAVIVHAGQDVRDLLVELPAQNQTISGTVLGIDGAPQGDVLVECQLRSATAPEDRTVTDIAGRFRCENLRPRHAYHLTAYSPEGASSDLAHVRAGASDVVLRLKNLVGLRVLLEAADAGGDRPSVFLKRGDGEFISPNSTTGGHHFVGLEPGAYTIVRFGLAGEEDLRRIQVDSRPQQEITLAPN